MSIRATYQPQIDEFMSNLESFATGDYLNENEKEFWDQPFDPKALLHFGRSLSVFSMLSMRSQMTRQVNSSKVQ